MPQAKYYWDAGLFIALLTNEQRRDPSDMPGLFEIVDLADAEEAIIVTSANTFGEVLDRPGHQPIRDQLRSLFQRPNFVLVEPNVTIIEKAADYREEFRLRLPDATHLATAVLYRVDEMHTFDEDDLIPLSGRASLNNLRIRKPSAPQKRLDLG